MLKFCKDCSLERDLSFFNKNPNGILGVEPRCKECQSLYNKEYNIKNKEIRSLKAKIYYQNNKEVIKKKVKAYCSNNKEKIRADRKNNYIKNRASIIKKTGDYRKKRIKEDHGYKLISLLRHRLNESLKRKKWLKNTHFYEYIGCDLNKLKSHIESQFQYGMNWSNHSKDGWHIDHIVPLSSAKTEEELYQLCHYSNLRPLWAIENLRKGKNV